jgi:hypothetical protein
MLLRINSEQTSFTADRSNAVGIRDRIAQLVFDHNCVFDHRIIFDRFVRRQVAAIAIMPPPKVVPRSFSLIFDERLSFITHAPRGRASETFCECNDIGFYVPRESTSCKKPVSCPADTSLYLIKYQCRSVFVT